jgi:hypothetical protein
MELNRLPPHFLQAGMTTLEQLQKMHAEASQQDVQLAPAESERRQPARTRLLEEAIKITAHDRNKAYGNPEDNFANIAEYWSAYLTQSQKQSIIVSSQDIAHLMILMKIARLATNPNHRDSLVDVAGYAACAADCQEQHQRDVKDFVQFPK